MLRVEIPKQRPKLEPTMSTLRAFVESSHQIVVQKCSDDIQDHDFARRLAMISHELYHTFKKSKLVGERDDRRIVQDARVNPHEPRNSHWCRARAKHTRVSEWKHSVVGD